MDDTTFSCLQTATSGTQALAHRLDASQGFTLQARALADALFILNSDETVVPVNVPHRVRSIVQWETGSPPSEAA